MTIHSITLNIKDASHIGGKATIGLFVHEKRLMDSGAALACQVEVQVPPDETITEILHVDTSSEDQIGVGWDQMQDPSMYVALISDLSELGYAGGPVFNLSPGDTAELVLASKN
ncbi:hypothetical protein MHU86_6488 [Fragilaria crotonensis]|nr:hypothetical protein MHU86_6488 [Fragilaria crotonensis]